MEAPKLENLVQKGFNIITHAGEAKSVARAFLKIVSKYAQDISQSEQLKLEITYLIEDFELEVDFLKKNTQSNHEFLMAREKEIFMIKELQKCVNKKANDLIIKAEQEHFSLIQYEAQGNVLVNSLLLVHAEDQLISTQMMLDLIDELVLLHLKDIKLEKGK